MKDFELMKWLDVVMHFSDSALPVGSYAHSFGLEGMCQMGLIKDSLTFKLFLERDVQHALESIDLPLSLRAYDAVILKNKEACLHWDEMADALRATAQLSCVSKNWTADMETV